MKCSWVLSLKLNVPVLDIEHNLIERVSGFKLLEVHNFY